MGTSKAVAKKQTAAVAAPIDTDLMGSWGSEGVDDSDLLIPRILLMQALSEFVTEGKAKAGDICKSATGEVLCEAGKTFEVIPLKTWKSWRVSQYNGGKYETKYTEPMTAENVNSPGDWEEDGTQWRRDREMNFYVLLPQDIVKEVKAIEKIKAGEMPDPDDALIPCLLTLRRTSYPAGRAIVTQFKKAAHFGMPPAATVLQIGTQVVKGDKGTYFTFVAEKSRQSTPDELKVAKKWFNTLETAEVIHDETSADEEVTVTEGMNDNF